MATNDAEKSSHNKHDPAWRVLASFWLANEPDNLRLAAERVETAVRELEWPAANLAPIGQAVYRAAHSALERGPTDGRLIVRLFVPAVEATAVGVTPPAPQAGRGWGFFLVQKGEEDSSLPAGAQQSVIEVFLYQE